MTPSQAIVILLLATALPRSSPAQERAADRTLAITNVTVLPMDRERTLPGYTFIIAGGSQTRPYARITHLGPADRIAIPAGAERIDGTGKYLIPGLVDTHVHLGNASGNDQLAILKLFVANGVTTVVNLRGTPPMLELRSAVAEGRVFGPSIYTVGPYVNEPFVTTPDGVERAVVEQKRAGYDFVKLHGNLSRDAYLRLMAVARREGIRVIGHAPRNLGLDIMFEQRQYALAHAEEFLYDRNNNSTDSSLAQVEAQIPRFARSTAQARIWLMPNLTGYKSVAVQVKDLAAFLASPDVQHLPATVRTGWGPATNPYTTRIPPSRAPGIMARYRLLEKMARQFHAAGVRLLVGTDAMNPGVVPGFSVHDELADLVAAGLTPYEALRAGTANAAEFLAVGNQRGTVAVGQNADLVLLDANPLVEIGNTRRIAGVVLRGRWIAKSEISGLLE
jgi:imidazolonepropionase-like amidohydrolase